MDHHQFPIKPYNKLLYETLKDYDPEVQKIIDDETFRQFSSLELNASENLTSIAVMETNGSILNNRFTQTMTPRHEKIKEDDELQSICKFRALRAFRLDPKIWDVNVQLYSGSTANFSTLTALLQPQDRIMGLGLPDGGHLTHGFYTSKSKISASSIYFQSFPYSIDPESKLIDYDYLEKTAKIYKPRVVICGASAYPRDWDYKRLRKIADDQGAYLMMDMAQVSGLIAGQALKDPFDYCDIVTTTTHKTLRGPRGGLIFFRTDRDPNMKDRIDQGVFPSFQGAVHYHSIAAAAVALKQAADPSFQQYAQAVIENSRALAARLVELGYSLQTGGSDNHLVLWDLRPIGLTGSKFEKICDLCHITINMNAISGDDDTSAQVQGGVRLGTSALTSRSMGPSEMVEVANFLDRVVKICQKIQVVEGDFSKSEVVSEDESDLMRFTTYEGGGRFREEIDRLKIQVKEFSQRFDLPPGFRSI